MQVTIKTAMGGTILEEVAPSAQVLDLKKLIACHIGIPSEHQRLTFAGVQLESGKKMQDCGIEDNATLHMTVPLTIMTSSACEMQINVWIGHLGKAFRFSVEESSTLGRVMSIAHTAGRLEGENLVFIKGCRYLECEHTLLDYKIQCGDWLRLCFCDVQIRVRGLSGETWLVASVSIHDQLNVLADLLMAKRPGRLFSFILSRGTAPIADMTRTLLSLGLEDGSEIFAVAEEMKPPQASWHLYSDINDRDQLWWHNEENEDWFFENQPHPWVHYKYPGKDNRTWWWNSETHDWFNSSCQVRD